MASPSVTRRLGSTFGLVVIAACSQLAGFETLTGDAPERDDAAGGGGASAGLGGASAGLGGSSVAGRPSGGAPITEGGRSAGGTGGSGDGGRGPSAGSGGKPPVAGSDGSSPGGVSAGGAGGATDDGDAGMGNGVGEGGAVGGCDRQLLRNAGFDRGRTTWVEENDYSPTHPLIRHRDDARLIAADVAPDAGDYLAWLGGFPDVEFRKFESRLTQEVSIPEDAAYLRMTGSIWIVTEDAEPGADGFVMELQEDGTPRWLPYYWYNDDANGGWARFDFQVGDERMALMRGKTLTFFIESRQDEGTPTSFIVDSLRLVAGCGQ